MWWTEKTIEKIVVKLPEIIFGEGSRIIGTQVVLPSRRRVDVLAQDSSGKWVIAEIKREKIDDRAVSQLLQYMGEFACDLSHLNGKKLYLCEVRGILVGPSITKRATRMLYAVEQLDYWKLDPESRCLCYHGTPLLSAVSADGSDGDSRLHELVRSRSDPYALFNRAL